MAQNEKICETCQRCFVDAVMRARAATLEIEQLFPLALLRRGGREGIRDIYRAITTLLDISPFALQCIHRDESITDLYHSVKSVPKDGEHKVG